MSHMVKIRADRIAAGLCRDCGKCAPIAGKKNCESCKERTRVNTQIRNYGLKLRGLCADCMKPTDSGNIVCMSCMDKRVVGFRDKRKENKELIYNYFGCKCSACGETDIVVMTLDHVDNDGYLDKKSETGKRVITPTWYAKLAKLIKAGLPMERNLQMLCFNCHAKKDLVPWWLR